MFVVLYYYERNYLRRVRNDVLTFTWGDIVVERNAIGRCITSIFKKELPHITTSPCTKKNSKNWPVKNGLYKISNYGLLPELSDNALSIKYIFYAVNKKF